MLPRVRMPFVEVKAGVAQEVEAHSAGFQHKEHASSQKYVRDDDFLKLMNALGLK